MKMAGALCAVLLTCSVATSARADDKDQQVVDLMKKAMAAESAGHLPEAEALYRQAFAIKPLFDDATNLGLIEVKLGEWRAGCQDLSYAMARFPATLKHEIRENSTKGLDLAAAHVARVHVTVSTAGANVLVDTTNIGLSPVSDVVCLEPGHHDFRGAREGYEDGATPYEAKAGAVDDVTVTLKAKQSGDLGKTEKPGVKPVWPYALTGGIAVVGLGVGAGLLGWGFTAASSINEQIKSGACHSVATCNGAPALQSLAQRHNTGITGGAVAMSVGGAALIGLVTYALLPAPKATAAQTGIVPILGSTEAGLGVQGSF